MSALTSSQKRSLKKLKQKLNFACSLGDVEGGKKIVNELRLLLTPTGHKVKYYEMLLYFSEMIILKEELATANKLLTHVATNTNENTRINQEANLILAICKLHMHDLVAAENFLRKALNSKAIKDVARRKIFLKSVSRRFEEEALIVSFGVEQTKLDVDAIIIDVQNKFMSNCSNSELIEQVGRSVPPESIDFARNIYEMAKKQLPCNERKMLSPPSRIHDYSDIGAKVFSGVSRRIWLSLCLPNSRVQKTLSEIDDMTLIVKRVISEINHLKFKIMPIIACVTAIIIKNTVNGYCKKYKPVSVMDARYRR